MKLRRISGEVTTSFLGFNPQTKKFEATQHVDSYEKVDEAISGGTIDESRPEHNYWYATTAGEIVINREHFCERMLVGNLSEDDTIITKIQPNEPPKTVKNGFFNRVSITASLEMVDVELPWYQKEIIEFNKRIG